MGPLPRHTKMCAAGALALQILACRVGSLEAWINKVYEALWDLPRSGRLWGPTKTLCSTFLERCLLPSATLGYLDLEPTSLVHSRSIYTHQGPLQHSETNLNPSHEQLRFWRQSQQLGAIPPTILRRALFHPDRLPMTSTIE